MSAGFDRAPVSRFLVGICGVSSVISLFISSRRKVFPYLNLNISDVFSKFQFWRLLSTHVFFGSAAELVLGLILLYNFRLFERHFGTRKYGGAIFFFIVAATLLDLALLAAIPSEYFPATATGPYAIVFALLPSFIIDIPKIAPFKVFGIPLSEKFFTYLLGLQLAFAAPTPSFFTAFVAFLVGWLYRWERLPFHQLRVPVALMRFCDRISQQVQMVGRTQQRFGGGRVGGGGSSGHSLLAGAAPTGLTPPVSVSGSGAGAGRPAAGSGSSNGSAADFSGFVAGAGSVGSSGYERLPMNESDGQSPSGVEASPAGVTQLVSMGFGEMEARTALSATNNNVEAAMNVLLASR